MAAAPQTIEIPIRVTIEGDPRPEAERFMLAAAQSSRHAKRVRAAVRDLDRSLAELLEATHALFGIEYGKEHSGS
jgi:hypothetical protein